MGKYSTNGEQVLMHQLDQCQAEQKIEPDERDQRRRIVEHSPGSFLYLPALFDEVRFQDFPQAAEAPQRFDHLLERRAPRERVGVHFSEYRLHHLSDIYWLDLLVTNLRRGPERKVLPRQEGDLVPHNIALLRLAQMALNQRAQSCLAGLQP